MKKTSVSKLLVFAAMAVMATAASAAAVDPQTILAHSLAAFSDPSALGLLGFGAAGVTGKALRDLQAKKTKLVAAMRALTDKAAADGRDLTDDEVSAFDANKRDLEKTNASIEREQLLIAAEAGVTVSDGAEIRVEENIDKDPKLGFATFGDFAAAVKAAGGKNPSVDARFAAAPSLFVGEGSGADGGWLVPPQYSSEIFTLALEEDSLLPLTDNVELGKSNSMPFPKDESTPWGSDGVRAYWQNEGTAGNATKINLTGSRLTLHKLLALVPVADEMLEDSTALGSYLPGLMARSIRWKANEAFMFGTGNGQPAGAFNSNAVVTVAKESGQANGTLDIMNIAKMIARLPPGSFGRAVWMLNNDVLPFLFTLKLGDHAIYIPASEGAKVNPYGSLMGRPIMITQHAKSIGAQGDVVLADWKGYRTISKAGGIQTATSMHLYFDADSTAFRTTFRIDGQSKLSAAINPANGSNKLSPFVQLGAR